MADTSADEWLARLDALGSYGSLDALRRLLEDAPAGARRTADYCYARGVVDVRTEAELADPRGTARPAGLPLETDFTERGIK